MSGFADPVASLRMASFERPGREEPEMLQRMGLELNSATQTWRSEGQ